MPGGTSLMAVLLMGAVGYLLGSIPFGIVLTRLTGGPDLRTIGSGNIGATNVLRTGNKALAVATLLGDMLKGTVAVLIGWRFGAAAAMAAGLAAFLGHLFPIWLRFKGGKGVATYLGVLIGFKLSTAVTFALVWVLVALLSRYSSLSALVASLLTPLALWLSGADAMALLAVPMTALLWFMHRENIRRLLAGTEGRIGQK